MAGYSKTPLIGKLGIKPGMRIALIRMPASVLHALQPLPEGVEHLARPGKEMDMIHYFAEGTSDLEKAFATLKNALSKSGSLWISWRKGKNNTDLTEDIIRAIALKNSLVDIKVCAVDDTWSALKLVFRLKDR